MPRRRLLAALTFALAAGAPARADDDRAGIEFFEKEIRPILAGRCHECHGPAKQKAGLRLDSHAGVLAGGDSGPAVEPGQSAESLLVEVVGYESAVKMPPRSKLPEAEIAALSRWIAMGAPWPAEKAKATTAEAKPKPRPWSFEPVRAVEPPAVADESWPLTPIDRFLLAALESRGLTPSPEADRRTWLRRVTFDLTGLPPTIEEIDTFLADDRPEAYERVVDRLLDSPRYGERWARHWLDVVRFAETSGHEFDYDIPFAWRYRDYVIRALNADLPYDRFVVEHVAGDLVPSPRRDPATGRNESLVGTAFYRLHEGTHSPVDLPDDRAARLDNQVDVLGKAFLGLTIACARCHDHKFDPIAQTDYYAIAGMLSSSRHALAFLDAPERISEPARQLDALRAELAGTLQDGTPVPPAPRDPEVFEAFDGPGFAGWWPAGDAFGDGPTDAGEVTVRGGSVVRLAAGWAHSGRRSDRLRGALRSGDFAIDKRFIHLRVAGRGGRVNLVVDGFDKIRDPIYGGLTRAVDWGDEPRWLTIDAAMWAGQVAYLELADGATVDFTGGTAVVLPGDGWLAIDAIRFSDGPAPAATESPGPFLGAAEAPASSASLERFAAIEAALPEPELAPALIDGPGRDLPLHVRGSTKNLGAPVPRRFLASLGGDQHPPASPESSGRLALAERLVDPANPLVARVIVNRLWKHHFGEGIVASPDDFGAMGQAPTHPELLDWLAAELPRRGWSLKAIHRLMVLSRAYRMQSARRPEAEAVDPTNAFLHRARIRRLEGEAIRDAILAASGRLDPSLYGPGVPPHLSPFMEGRGRPGSSGPIDGDGRRSVYLNIRRNFLSPFLVAFDLPTPAAPMGRRNVSNVPAQALVLLNDPFVVAEARRWADRALAEDRPPGEAVDRLFLAAYGRPATGAERAAALAFLADRPGIDGWADLCHVLINGKEFLFVP